MTTESDILRLRLARQSIETTVGSDTLDPAGVVERLLALQAQDYPGALWSIGLSERLFVYTRVKFDGLEGEPVFGCHLTTSDQQQYGVSREKQDA